MVVSLNTPQEMTESNIEGLSVWLYAVVRDKELLNNPPQRISQNEVRSNPLPLRLHYMMTPIIEGNGNISGPETEQAVLGKVLQSFNDHPILRGSDLMDDFSGTTQDLKVRLEPLTLEEITRVWEALDRSYQLSVSYEVTDVKLYTGLEPVDISPVEVAMPEYGVIVSSEKS